MDGEYLAAAVHFAHYVVAFRLDGPQRAKAHWRDLRLSTPMATLGLAWENYKRMLTEHMPFVWFIRNNLKISLMAVLGRLLLCSLTAHAFARLEFPGYQPSFKIWSGCLMIPLIVLVIPIRGLFNELDWLDTILPLIVTYYFGGAFTTFLTSIK